MNTQWNMVEVEQGLESGELYLEEARDEKDYAKNIVDDDIRMGY